jgi:hypothetical protein
MKGSWLAVCVLALGGCPTVDFGESPAGIGVCNPDRGEPYFEATIWPQYIRSPATNCGPNKNLSCDCAQSSCHGGAHGPDFDTTLPTDYVAMYRLSQQFLNCGAPTASPLLTRPLAGIDGHGGGDLFTTSEPQYQIFLDWFH